MVLNPQIHAWWTEWGESILGLLLTAFACVLWSARKSLLRVKLRGDLHNPSSYRMSGPLQRRRKDGQIEVYSRPVLKDEVFLRQRGDSF